MRLSAPAVFVLVVLALCLPLSCGGPTFVVQHYDGPARPREAVALIRVHGADRVQIAGVDGQPTGSLIDRDARLHIEVLPGEHSLDVAVEGDRTRRVWFEARPGGVYRPVWNAGQEPRVFEIDEASDAFLADATLSGPKPLPAVASEPAPLLPPAPVPAPAPPPPVTSPPPEPFDAGAETPDAGAALDGAAPPDGAAADAAPDAG